MTLNLFESVTVFAFSFLLCRQHNTQILTSFLLGQVCTPLMTPLITPATILQILSSCCIFFLKWRPYCCLLTLSRAFLHITTHRRTLWAIKWELGLRAWAAIVRVPQEAVWLASHPMTWAQTIPTGTCGFVPRLDPVTGSLSLKLPLSEVKLPLCPPAPEHSMPPSILSTAWQVLYSKWLKQQLESDGAEFQGRTCSGESCEMSPLHNPAPSIHHWIIL